MSGIIALMTSKQHSVWIATILGIVSIAGYGIHWCGVDNLPPPPIAPSMTLASCAERCRAEEEMIESFSICEKEQRADCLGGTVCKCTERKLPEKQIVREYVHDPTQVSGTGLGWLRGQPGVVSPGPIKLLGGIP